MKVLARYASDGAPAIAERRDASSRRVYVCEPGGLSPALFNRLARESGAYVPVAGTGLQVDMNGDFVSLHATKTGRFDFRLPFDATVVNLKTNRVEPSEGGVVRLNLTAGETVWLGLSATGSL